MAKVSKKMRVLGVLVLVLHSCSASLRVQTWNNALALSSPQCSTKAGFDFSASACAIDPAVPLTSVRFDGSFLPPPAKDGAKIEVMVECNLPVRLFIHSWKLVDAWDFAPQPDKPALVNHTGASDFTVVASMSYPLRLEMLSFGAAQASLRVLWRKSGGSGTWSEVAADQMSSTIAPSELRRQALQASLGVGWNTWHRASAAAHVHLPSGFGVALALQSDAGAKAVSWDAVDKCLNGTDCFVRPGRHTLNGSLTEMIQRLSAVGTVDPALVTATSVQLGREGVMLLLEANPMAATKSYSALRLLATAGFYFGCEAYDNASACGTYTSTIGSPLGWPSLAISIVAGAVDAKRTPDAKRTQAIAFDAATSTVCIVVAPHARRVQVAEDGAAPLPRTAKECIALAQSSRSAYDGALDRRFPRAKVGQHRDAAEAIQSVVGWNVMWDFSVKVVTPVSRSFGVRFVAPVWLWDTYFCTLLAAVAEETPTAKAIAYSNLIEVTRPTVMGNVPGIRTLTQVATDRSKPFVGALVALSHWKRFHDTWIITQIFDDLLLWANWIRDRRTLPVTSTGRDGDGEVLVGGLIALGSDNVTTAVQGGIACSRKHAVWESGLDNSVRMRPLFVCVPPLAALTFPPSLSPSLPPSSLRHAAQPMYDGVDVVRVDAPNACLLPLADVGMTGLYLSTLDSLAQLAEALNRTVLASELRARHAAMAMSVNELLWDDAQSVYANRFLNGTFSQRISPFNFHVMLSGAATVERVDAMVSKWLLTDEGFCLTDKSKTKSSTYTAGGGVGAAAAASASMPCRYGLPSIAHSDAAFTDQNYWRGRTWGPMNYLVYIGLDHPKYAALASVQVAKKRLANASLSLLMGEWLTNHHVCENYNAETGVGGGPRPKGENFSTGASSNLFYHWGGLLGYVSLIEHKLV